MTYETVKREMLFLQNIEESAIVDSLSNPRRWYVHFYISFNMGVSDFIL